MGNMKEQALTEIEAVMGAFLGCSLEDRVDACNRIKDMLREISPFRDHPVDNVRWVPQANVVANDYNPNTVAPPEMRLLQLSIEADGYTQPIVGHEDDGRYVVVDGFHRNRVGREVASIRDGLHGYLPIVAIRARQSDIDNRMASTIRHNRARGKHGVEAMTGIVTYLAKKNWSDAKIAKELGMDADEVLRHRQISGLTEMFADRDFSEAWDVA